MRNDKRQGELASIQMRLNIKNVWCYKDDGFSIGKQNKTRTIYSSPLRYSVSRKTSCPRTSLAIHNSQVATLNSQLLARSSQFSTLGSQLTTRSSQLARLNSQLSALSFQLAARSSQFSTLGSQLAVLNSLVLVRLTRPSPLFKPSCAWRA